MPSYQADQSGYYCQVTLNITHVSIHDANKECYDTRIIKLSAPDQPVSIGRSSKRAGSRGPPSRNNAIFESPVVSRDHAQFSLDSTKHLFITDLDSMHGTFVNGQKLESRLPMLLQTDDCVTIGNSITPATGQAHTAVAFTVRIAFFPAPVSTATLIGSAQSKFQEQIEIDGMDCAAEDDISRVLYTTSSIPPVPSSDDLELSPPWDNLTSDLTSVSESSRRVSSTFSVPSESSFDSDEDDEGSKERGSNDLVQSDKVPRPLLPVNTSPDYSLTSPILELTTGLPACSAAPSNSEHATSSPTYSPASPLNMISNDCQHSACHSHCHGQSIAATNVETAEVRQEDIQGDLVVVASTKLRGQDDFDESALLQGSPTDGHAARSNILPSASSSRSIFLADDVDSLLDNEDQGAHPLGLRRDNPEIEAGTLNHGIATICCFEEPESNDELEATYHGLPSPEPRNCDDSNSALETSESWLCSSKSDLNKAEGKKRKIADDKIVTTPTSNVHADMGTCSGEQVAHPEVHSQPTTVAGGEPVRKKVRFETQPVAIQGRTSYTWHGAAVPKKTKSYIPTAMSFALGTLVGSAAIVGGLLALPDSFFV